MSDKDAAKQAEKTLLQLLADNTSGKQNAEGEAALETLVRYAGELRRKIAAQNLTLETQTSENKKLREGLETAQAQLVEGSKALEKGVRTLQAAERRLQECEEERDSYSKVLQVCYERLLVVNPQEALPKLMADLIARDQEFAERCKAAGPPPGHDSQAQLEHLSIDEDAERAPPAVVKERMMQLARLCLQYMPGLAVRVRDAKRVKARGLTIFGSTIAVDFEADEYTLLGMVAKYITQEGLNFTLSAGKVPNGSFELRPVNYRPNLPKGGSPGDDHD